MKTKSSLVRSDRTVELYAVSCVHMSLSVVVNPRHAELNLSLRLCQSLKKGLFAVLLLICLDHRAERLKYFFDSLMEFRLSRVLFHD